MADDTCSDSGRTKSRRTARPAIDRLAERLSAPTPNGCLEYTGAAATRSGHKQIWSDGRMVLAHRVAWEAAKGPIPDGLCVCHRCDNPPCCNPAHLFLGTVADNNADRDRKGRQVSVPGHLRAPRLKPPIVHGTITAYVKRKCRCDACRAANATYRKIKRAGR